VGARFSALAQTGPGAHSASYRMGTGSFPGAKRSERGRTDGATEVVVERGLGGKK
jgi:hypothetical protein